jgi:poly(hydroxyalkanoate) granule-associated protein
MPKKQKNPAGNGSDMAAQVRESATQIWLAGLGAFSKAQTEGSKIFDALVKEGEAVQKRTRKAAEERVAEFRDNAAGTWGKLEDVFEERVARVLHALNVPTKKDIDHLSRRIGELTAAVSADKRRGGTSARA